MNRTILGAIALATSLPASAVVYELDASGRALEYFNYWECGCTQGPVDVSWNEAFFLDAPQADGVYSLTRLTFEGLTLQGGFSDNPLVTIQGGEVTGLTGTFSYPQLRTSFVFAQGNSVSGRSEPDHGNGFDYRGIWTDPPAMPVPEPESWALMLFGLGLLWSKKFSSWLTKPIIPSDSDWWDNQAGGY